MTPDLVFAVANAIAAASWLLLIALPRRRWVPALTGGAVPAIFAAVYVAIVATVWGRADGSFATLAGVAALFTHPWMLLAGWLHYLAFDLLIGTWEARDARERGMRRALLIPCLIATFLFGPAGWLLYVAFRSRVAAGRVRQSAG
jgi:hypothetical protein